MPAAATWDTTTPGLWQPLGHILPCSWAEASDGWEHRIGWLWAHDHFLVAGAPGKPGIWFSQLFGGRLALLPLLSHGMGNSPNTETGSPLRWGTLSVPVMIIISPGFLLMDVVKLYPFPRTGGEEPGPY